MNYEQIERQLRTTPSLRLLRLDNAPLIISFLHRTFKRGGRLTIPASELTRALDAHLADMRAADLERSFRTAAAYLKLWCDDEHRLLRSFYEPNDDDPRYELTPDAERAIGWFEELQGSAFVGTESRFLRIFALLEELAGRGAEDAPLRLEQLERQRATIDAEIARIRATGEVDRLTPTQLRERFIEANDTARRLVADFREVEQNFRQIATEVQRAYIERGEQKGAVVGQVLDADDALSNSDQGRSFYAFRDFLYSPSRQDALRDLLRQTLAIELLSPLRPEYPLLERLKADLLDATNKVVQSNYRLGEQLRRMLDERQVTEHRRIRELIGSIKQAALSRSADPPQDPAFWSIAGDPEVRLPIDRPLHQPTVRPDFAAHRPQAAAVTLQDADFAPLLRQVTVDRGLLRDRIAALTSERGAVTLGELLAVHPPRHGLAEVLTYIAIAADGPAHTIDRAASEDLPLDDGEAAVRAPLVLFVREESP